MKQFSIKNKKIGFSWKFLFVMMFIYVLGYLVVPYIILEALLKTLAMLYKILPILLLVFVVMFFINLLAKEERMRKYLGKDSGARGWFYAVIGGILISGPPYILFPLLGDMKKHGMKKSLIAVFLYNRNVKIPFIPVMAYYFGWEYTVILSVLIIVFSIANGLIVAYVCEK